MQLGRGEQALRCTAPPSGACSDISPSCLSLNTVQCLHSPYPASLPPPSFLLILGALSFILTSSFLSLHGVTRQENADLCIPYTCFSFFPVHLWLLISPSRRWVSLSSLLPLSLTFPLLLVRHSFLSCCETFMLSHTVKWSLSRSLNYISSIVHGAF